MEFGAFDLEVMTTEGLLCFIRIRTHSIVLVNETSHAYTCVRSKGTNGKRNGREMNDNISTNDLLLLYSCYDQSKIMQRSTHIIDRRTFFQFILANEPNIHAYLSFY